MRVRHLRRARRCGARRGGPGQPPHDQRPALQAVLGEAPGGAAPAQRRRHGPRAPAGHAPAAGRGADGVDSSGWRAIRRASRGSSSSQLLQPAAGRRRAAHVPVSGPHEHGHLEAVSARRRRRGRSRRAEASSHGRPPAVLWRAAAHDGLPSQLARRRPATHAAASGHAAARAAAAPSAATGGAAASMMWLAAMQLCQHPTADRTLVAACCGICVCFGTRSFAAEPGTYNALQGV